MATFQDNIAYATEIRFLGGEQFNLTVFLGVANVTFLSHEYFLSFLDNANIIYNAISAVKTRS